jgi:hypothetical protein
MGNVSFMEAPKNRVNFKSEIFTVNQSISKAWFLPAHPQ